MKHPPPKTRRAMELAAELRAAGATWETVAEKLQRRAFVIQRWGKLYAETWEQMLRDAEERLSRQGNNESRSTLRTMLRDENKRLRLTAADKLMRVRLAELEHEATPDPREDLSAFMAQVEGMTDEELETVLGEFVEHVRAGGAGHDAGACEDRGGGVEGAPGAERPG
jgi:hypothetical protein